MSFHLAKTEHGFTLAELLIALAILGVIAVFAIPKLLQAQQAQQWNAMSKEAAATVSEAYQLYRLKNTPNALTKPQDFLPYLNYIREDNASLIDNPCGGTLDCSTSRYCYVLHNGGVLDWGYEGYFNGTGDLNAIHIRFDPDGKVTPGGSNAVSFWLYFNGQILTDNTLKPGTTNQYETAASPSACDPTWFKWGT